MATAVGNRHGVGRATRISCHKPRDPRGGHVGTRFLRTGRTVFLQLSQNLVGIESTIPRPFRFAVHRGTVAAPVAGNKNRHIAEKGELSAKTRYSCSNLKPVLDVIQKTCAVLIVVQPLIRMGKRMNSSPAPRLRVILSTKLDLFASVTLLL